MAPKFLRKLLKTLKREPLLLKVQVLREEKKDVADARAARAESLASPAESLASPAESPVVPDAVDADAPDAALDVLAESPADLAAALPDAALADAAVDVKFNITKT